MALAQVRGDAGRPGGSAPADRIQPWMTLLLVGVAAAGWRILYLHRLHGTALAGLLDADSRVYWEWARKIRETGGGPDCQFFLGPLYPYALACLGALGLRSVGAVQALQSLLSVGSILLVSRAAIRLHGARWGILSGLLCAGCSMWVFLDSQILMECLLLALQAGLLGLTVGRPGRGVSCRRAAVIGLIVGVMALGRATALLLLLPVGAWMVGRLQWKGAWRPLAAMCVVVALLAVPASLRSLATVGELIPYTYSCGYNLFVGNGPGSNGTFQIMPADAGGGPGPGRERGGPVWAGIRRASSRAPRDAAGEFPVLDAGHPAACRSGTRTLPGAPRGQGPAHGEPRGGIADPEPPRLRSGRRADGLALRRGFRGRRLARPRGVAPGPAALPRIPGRRRSARGRRPVHDDLLRRRPLPGSSHPHPGAAGACARPGARGGGARAGVAEGRPGRAGSGAVGGLRVAGRLRHVAGLAGVRAPWHAGECVLPGWRA